MARREVLDRIEKYVDPFRITKGKGFRLDDFDPSDTRDLRLGKGEAADLLQRGTQWLAEEQDMLYAQKRWSLLVLFQAMDGFPTSRTSRTTLLDKGRSFSSSSCMCRARSRRSVSWSASTSQTNIGNFRPPTCTNASSGATTCTRFRKQFGLQHRNAHRGTWCRLTTSGLPGSLSPQPL